jgi:hypothetical protein
MSFKKINISIPKELDGKLSTMIESGKKSSFIASCIAHRLDEVEKELKEYYSQGFPDKHLWEHTIGEGLNDCNYGLG